LLPHDLPAWSTVFGIFRQWRQSGFRQRLNDTLECFVLRRLKMLFADSAYGPNGLPD
jgi:hypothetical protein